MKKRMGRYLKELNKFIEIKVRVIWNGKNFLMDRLNNR